MDIVFSRRVIRHHHIKPDLQDVIVKVVEERQEESCSEIRRQEESGKNSEQRRAVYLLGNISSGEEEENRKNLEKLKKSFDISREERDATNETQDSRKQCPICYKNISKNYYRVHYRAHMHKQMYPCKFCNSRFTRRNDARRHEKSMHSGETNSSTKLQEPAKKQFLKCSECSAVFLKKKYLENHIRFIHPNKNTGESTEIAGEYDIEDPDDVQPREKSEGNIQDPDGQAHDDEMSTKSELSPDRSARGSLSKFAKGGDMGPGRSSGIEILDQHGNVGRLMKVEDNVFMIVDCSAKLQDMQNIQIGDSQSGQQSEDTEDTGEAWNSQDAVQTLIDAVQELIEKHEASEVGSSATKICSSDGNLCSTDPHGTISESSLSAGDLERLAKQFPGSRFLFVNDMK